jgi:hypothetical protein
MPQPLFYVGRIDEEQAVLFPTRIAEDRENRVGLRQCKASPCGMPQPELYGVRIGEERDKLRSLQGSP